LIFKQKRQEKYTTYSKAIREAGRRGDKAPLRASNEASPKQNIDKENFKNLHWKKRKLKPMKQSIQHATHIPWSPVVNLCRWRRNGTRSSKVTSDGGRADALQERSDDKTLASP